mmetsp:Transcript_13069/g.45942  ORF Transcript_13069/g.45942 Transcript_13069/m.45942 type:complete len:214 (+) Transcript_13069:343-984(+)
MSVCRWLHEPDRSFDMVEKEEPRTGNSRCDDHHALELYSLFVVTCPKASRHSRHSAVSVQSSYAEIPDFRAIYYIQGAQGYESIQYSSWGCLPTPKKFSYPRTGVPKDNSPSASVQESDFLAVSNRDHFRSSSAQSSGALEAQGSGVVQSHRNAGISSCGLFSMDSLEHASPHKASRPKTIALRPDRRVARDFFDKESTPSSFMDLTMTASGS